MQHTELPWHTGIGCPESVHAEDSACVCDCDCGEPNETILDNAAFIVKACNNHKRLIELNVALLSALEEICEPTLSDYYTGIRCGVEDRDLQSDSYEAAEYGYDQGKEYCQFIASQAIKQAEEE